MLFAQAAPPPAGPPPGVLWGVIAGVCACYLLIPVGYFLIKFFFSRTAARVLERCNADTRSLEPGLAYLNMIPCGGELWFVISAFLVGRSLRVEFEERGLDDRPGGYGQAIAILAAVALVGSMVAQYAPFIPLMANPQAIPNPQFQLIGGIGACGLWLMAFALFVVYWVRLAGFGRQLADDDDMREGQETDRREPDEEDDHDHDD